MLLKRFFDLQIFIMLSVCSVLIIGLSYIGNKAYGQLFEQKVFQANTALAHIELGGLTTDEALAKITDEIEIWKETTTFTLVYRDTTVEIAGSEFEFDVPGSLQQVKEGADNSLIATLAAENLDDKINRFAWELDRHELLARLTEGASQLAAGGSIELAPYVMSENAAANATVAKGTVPIGAEYQSHITNFLDSLGEITIKAKETFSLLEAVKASAISSRQETALHMLATAIYEAVLPTNFEIRERYISRSLPDFAEIGKEAFVSSKDMIDLRIYNPNETSYTLQLLLDRNELHALLRGKDFLHKYEIEIKDYDTFSPKTIVQYSAIVKAGTYKVKDSGKDGLIAKVYRNRYELSGKLNEATLLSEDFYAPLPRIEVHSLATDNNLTEKLAEEPDADETNEESGIRDDDFFTPPAIEK